MYLGGSQIPRRPEVDQPLVDKREERRKTCMDCPSLRIWVWNRPRGLVPLIWVSVKGIWNSRTFIWSARLKLPQTERGNSRGNATKKVWFSPSLYIRIFQITFILPSKVYSDTSFLSHLWTDLAEMLLYFWPTVRSKVHQILIKSVYRPPRKG